MSNVLQLRNYIPIGGPARREPVDGTEASVRPSIGFEPGWYHTRVGVDFSERYHFDPLYRYESVERMKAFLVERFPRIPNWESSNRSATISGIFGIYPVAHAFGRELLYRDNDWPELVPAEVMTLDEMERLDHRVALNSAAMETVLAQIDTLHERYGPVGGYLNWQGVLNIAFQLRGQSIFLDMYDEPETAHHFFDEIAETLIALPRTIQAKQRETGFDVDLFAVSNCVMNMISPEQYEEFILPRDTRIAESYGRFGVHTCEWDVTPYIEVLSKLPKLGYLDMGSQSDMRRVRDAFPNARRTVIYSPVKLQDSDPETIRSDVLRIAEAIAPVDIAIPDIQAVTPDERVNAFIDFCEEASGLFDSGVAK